MHKPKIFKICHKTFLHQYPTVTVVVMKYRSESFEMRAFMAGLDYSCSFGGSRFSVGKRSFCDARFCSFQHFP